MGVPHESPEQRLTARVGEIEGDRALAARVHLPPELAALPEPGAQGIAATRVLDLDDVGAVVGEDRRQHAAGDQTRAVDDTEARERAVHLGRVILRCWASASMTRARSEERRVGKECRARWARRN